jgi:hypothetical protein
MRTSAEDSPAASRMRRAWGTSLAFSSLITNLTAEKSSSLRQSESMQQTLPTDRKAVRMPL